MTNQYQISILVSTFLFALTVLFATNSFSQEISDPKTELPDTSSASTLPVLPKITVTGARIAPLTGVTNLDRKMIENLPSRNGNVSDLLNTVTGVQFSEETNSSFNAGEIKPSEISISGGKIYENNFLIDGISNNSVTDPNDVKSSDANNIPGHSQLIFLNTNLVEQINIYDHNVPARFGNFTGGVVETITKSPGTAFGGHVFYRYTSDKWTQFHLDEEDKEDFYNSDSETKQPKFTKQQTGFELNVPLTSNSGLLAAYTLNYSEIPLNNLTLSQDQYRKSENFFLKYKIETSPDQSLTITTIYAPYSEKHFLTRTKNSKFYLNGDNLALSTRYELNGLAGTLKIDAVLQKSEDVRNAPPEIKHWKSNFNDIPTSKDWGLLIGSNYSTEGGFGNLERNQRMISLLADWASLPVMHGLVEQTLNLGFAFDRIEAEMIRPETVFSYSTPQQHLLTDIPCLEGDTTCIDGDQYLSKRNTSLADQSDDLVFQYNAYIEDQLVFDRLLLRPGIRISRDTLMDNTDTAPRLAATYELSQYFGTTLIGGWNRYYSQNLLAFKLREAIAPIIIDKMPVDESGNTFYEPFPEIDQYPASPNTRFSKLKTPYADEINAGISQLLLSGELKLDYVRRYFEDQLAKEYIPATADNSYYYILNNNGSGEYESYRIAWERQWPNQFLGINATYEETHGTNVNYDDRLSETDLLKQVYYRGKLLFKDELPIDDYNRPWTVNIFYSKVFRSQHLTFTNVTRYQSRYRTIEDSKEDHPDDGLPIYVNLTKPSSITFDWHIAQGIPLKDGRLLSINIDIFNIFNKKNHVGTEDKEYSLGRQIWAGLEYNF